MKININLQPLNNWGTGISMFGNKLVEQLSKNPEIKLHGCFNFIRGIKLNKLSRFSFPIKYSLVPNKIVYSKLIKATLPFYYHTMMGRKADINLFFTYKIPRVKYHGLTVCTIHDLIPLKVQQENEQIKRDYLDDISHAMRNSDYVLTVSAASKNDIVTTFNYPSNKIFIVPNGVDFEFFNKTMEDEDLIIVKKKYDLPEKFVLYFGNVRKHKNIENLIIAYSELPNSIKEEIKLVIVQGNKSLYQLAKLLKVDSHVCFTKFIDVEDAPAIYKLALCTAFISLYEGFGLPILEAMAAGTPVITSNVSAMPEVAGDSAILVDPLNIGEITEALQKVICSPELRENMSELGYLNAKKYSWDNSGKKLIMVLNQIIK